MYTSFIINAVHLQYVSFLLYHCEKLTIACHINKQSMLQLSAIAALQPELVSPEEIQEGKHTCHLAAIRLQPLPMVSSEETQDVKTQDTGPRELRCISKE